jgi:ribosomal protein S17
MSEAAAPEQTGMRRRLTGRVVSDKMEKTVTVLWSGACASLYNKFVARSKSIMPTTKGRIPHR